MAENCLSCPFEKDGEEEKKVKYYYNLDFFSEVHRMPNIKGEEEDKFYGRASALIRREKERIR